MTEEKRYDQFYSTWVCPYCNHNKWIKVPRGFFDMGPTIYKCSRCGSEFKNKELMVVLPKDETRIIVQGYLFGKITIEEMITKFEKIGLTLFKGSKFKKQR